MDRAAFDQLMEREGEQLQLVRPGSPAVTLDLKGKIYGGSSQTLVGAQAQRSRRAKIGNAEIEAAAWPGPPRRGDKLTDAGGQVYTVQTCDTRRSAGVVFAHFLEVLG